MSEAFLIIPPHNTSHKLNHGLGNKSTKSIKKINKNQFYRGMFNT